MCPIGNYILWEERFFISCGHVWCSSSVLFWSLSVGLVEVSIRRDWQPSGVSLISLCISLLGIAEAAMYVFVAFHLTSLFQFILF